MTTPTLLDLENAYLDIVSLAACVNNGPGLGSVVTRTGRNLAALSDIGSLTGYVSLSGDQTIDGRKIFNTSICVGGSAGTALISAQSSSSPAISLVKTGVAEWIFKADASSSALKITGANGDLLAFGTGVMASGANAAASAMFVSKDNSSSRSINAAGTINASGADYAEYYKKKAGCATIAKGCICGLNSDGLLTDVFSEAVRFKFKSTAPNLCGGDIWGSSETCGLTAPSLPNVAIDDPAYAGLEAIYTVALTAYNTAFEALRLTMDRIACRGKIPAVLTGSFAAGDLVLGVDNSGAIKAVTVSTSSATLAQHIACVGRVVIVTPSADQFKALLGPDVSIDGAWNAIIEV